MAFHKLRHLFPDMNSISTMQLKKLRESQFEHLGPGSYAASMEKPVQEKKSFNKPLAAPFGSLEERNLDTRQPGLKDNPGPGNYKLTSSAQLFGN